MHRDAARIFGTATLYWVNWLLVLWVAVWIPGALLYGPLDRYVIGFLSITPGWLGAVLAYAVTAGGVAWGDFVRDSGLRLVGPAAQVGLVVALVVGVLLGVIYPRTFEIYCAMSGPELCGDTARGVVAPVPSLTAPVLVTMAAINAVMGVLIAWATAGTQFLPRRRFERWAIAASVWLAGGFLGELLAGSHVPQSIGTAGPVIAPLVLPIVALGLLWHHTRLTTNA